MSNPQSASLAVSERPRLRVGRWIKLLIAAAVLAGAYAMLPSRPAATSGGTTFPVRRGPLRITVVEGGTIEALESQEIKSEVEGQTKILSIVEEGYSVTPEDLANGKILVELDATDLRERQTAQELEYQNSLAAFTEAKEAYDIQINQNFSDITAAELDVKFARMDFEKYLGAAAAQSILAKVPTEEIVAQAAASALQEASPDTAEAKGPDAGPAPAEPAQPTVETGPAPGTPPAQKTVTETPPTPEPAPEAPKPHSFVDFTDFARIEVLGDGEAGQKLRKLEDDFVLAKNELGLAKTNLEGTQRLAAKEFVTKAELENEVLKVQRNEISLQSAEISKELFIKYEFPKQAQKLLSDYEEALRKLERARKLALSKLAQAEARLKSSEARYTLQAQKRKQLQEQIEKCRIKAERAGLVVYASDDWRGQDQIQEGAMVRERQKIITIPDMNQMGAKVKIAEGSIKNVQRGQGATIRVDAFPDDVLTGEVTKVAVLPDSQNRWMNPDVKVYETVLSIQGVHPWLKPGMTAEVEILVDELPDVLSVPLQAVTPLNGDRVCYVASALTGPERRSVETGVFNDAFIEIKSGLNEGERVLLRAPITPEEASHEEAAKPGEPASAPPPEGSRPPRAPEAKT